MNVSEVMANVVLTVEKEDSLERVANVMREYDIGCVVVATGGRVDGIITDRDLVCRATARGKAMSGLKAAGVMTARVATCREDDTLKQAASIMEENLVRRLPVLDRHDRLVGIVSLGNIASHAPEELAGELIAELSRPEHHALAESA